MYLAFEGPKPNALPVITLTSPFGPPPPPLESFRPGISSPVSSNGSPKQSVIFPCKRLEETRRGGQRKRKRERGRRGMNRYQGDRGETVRTSTRRLNLVNIFFHSFLLSWCAPTMHYINMYSLSLILSTLLITPSSLLPPLHLSLSPSRSPLPCSLAPSSPSLWYPRSTHTLAAPLSHRRSRCPPQDQLSQLPSSPSPLITTLWTFETPKYICINTLCPLSLSPSLPLSGIPRTRTTRWWADCQLGTGRRSTQGPADRAPARHRGSSAWWWWSLPLPPPLPRRIGVERPYSEYLQCICKFKLFVCLYFCIFIFLYFYILYLCFVIRLYLSNAFVASSMSLWEGPNARKRIYTAYRRE